MSYPLQEFRDRYQRYQSSANRSSETTEINGDRPQRNGLHQLKGLRIEQKFLHAYVQMAQTIISILLNNIETVNISVHIFMFGYITDKCINLQIRYTNVKLLVLGRGCFKKNPNKAFERNKKKS